ncbi:MAG: hypothetical protein M1834_002917 [Cirrosporium novae-zelandiae]|nr:MAG: hypothetical protein M1834_002917 [Cirrosporium novae-zelandiae]
MDAKRRDSNRTVRPAHSARETIDAIKRRGNRLKVVMARRTDGQYKRVRGLSTEEEDSDNSNSIDWPHVRQNKSRSNIGIADAGIRYG